MLVLQVVLLGILLLLNLQVLLQQDAFTVLDYANLFIHEVGHPLFAPLGEWMMYLGGSLTQVLVPLLCALYFAWKKDLYASGLTLMWASESLLNVSKYIRDARLRELPLITDDPDTHDWWNLLIATNNLRLSEPLANMAVMVALMILTMGLLLAIRTLLEQSPQKAPERH